MILNKQFKNLFEEDIFEIRSARVGIPYENFEKQGEKFEVKLFLNGLYFSGYIQSHFDLLMGKEAIEYWYFYKRFADILNLELSLNMRTIK